MAIDFLLDTNSGDISLSNNSMQLTSTIEQSSRQQVLISLSTYRGEWAFNVEAGVPYLANDYNNIQLLGKSSKRLMDAALQEDILGRENITRLISFDSVLDLATQDLSVSFEAETNSGERVVVDNLPVVFI